MSVRNDTVKKFSVFLAGKEMRDKRKEREILKKTLELQNEENKILEISERIRDVIGISDEHYILSELEPFKDINEIVTE